MALSSWSRSIPALVSEDKRRTENLLESNEKNVEKLQKKFYSFMSMPLQSVCSVGKFFGGQWIDSCGALDGHKYVCLDKLYANIQSGECLIYSFGIANDWSFEEAMAQLGCTVRAFDPTIDGSRKAKTDKVIKKHWRISSPF